MKRRCSVLLLLWFSLQASQLALAAEDYEVLRTQWGLPDLQGVWNFSSNVPMQRPENFGARQYLTADEISAAQIQRFS